MLVSKTVRIEFADPRIRAVDALRDIRDAAKFVSLNLYSRHNVQLQIPMISDNNMVTLEIKIPEQDVHNFAIGNHLRGLSMYLLKKCNTRYEQYLVGKRLLTYTEIPAINAQEVSLTAADQLEAIATFAHLLQRSDPDSMHRIYRILAILKEEDETP